MSAGRIELKQGAGERKLCLFVDSCAHFVFTLLTLLVLRKVTCLREAAFKLVVTSIRRLKTALAHRKVPVNLLLASRMVHLVAVTIKTDDRTTLVFVWVHIKVTIMLRRHETIMLLRMMEILVVHRWHELCTIHLYLRPMLVLVHIGR